jgi:hypothetical protein
MRKCGVLLGLDTDEDATVIELEVIVSIRDADCVPTMVGRGCSSLVDRVDRGLALSTGSSVPRGPEALSTVLGKSPL